MSHRIISSEKPKVEVKEVSHVVSSAYYQDAQVLKGVLEKITESYGIPEEATHTWADSKEYDGRLYHWVWYETTIK